MKSAYELAMERLQAEAPAPALTDAQKQEIASVDERFRAKIAEREVFLGDLIAKAQAEGKLFEVAELEQQRAREIARFQEQAEDAKEAVRKGRHG